MQNEAKTELSSCFAHIGSGLRLRCGELLKEQFAPCRVAAVFDSNVAGIYRDGIIPSLVSAGFEVFEYTIPSGEDNKTVSTYLGLVSFLSENGFSRSDVVVSIGGGVTGDISGFAAGTYLRGISFVNMPTTLLSMVDSSVGGKTGVNLPRGKNLLGVFCQPSLIICDTDFLSTLPPEEMNSGYAEVIKTAVLSGEEMLSSLEQGPDISGIIRSCIEFKNSIVCQDERDNSVRRLLNFGHTVGHACEKLSSFTLRHGEAVSFGMSVMVRYAAKNGLCSESDSALILSILKAHSLPVSLPYSPSKIARAAFADKKISGDTITVIVPYGAGDCRCEKVTISSLEKIIAQGMEG